MRFCGVPENITKFLGQSGCQWPRGHKISVSIHSVLPALGYEKQLELTDDAFDAWRKVCGMEYEILSQNQPANIEIFNKVIDGAQGVLAQALLPCGARVDDRLWQQYDGGETWAKPGESGIDYRTVCIHETGHSLGWGHAPTQDCIMYAAYQGPNNLLCGWEKGEATTRYGQPGSTPPPPPPPNGDDDDFGCDDLLDCFTDILRVANARAKLRRSKRRTAG